MSVPVFLHVDLDAFFASVEQLDFPEYRGKPVIVGGKPGDRRSVVSTCSYEARKFGVHSAMSTAKAYELCPKGIYVYGRMYRYHEKSCEVMNIFNEFSPDVQQMSIDEAFIDITGTERLFGSPEDAARKLKQRVFDKTGLTVSVGIASNKYIAKIASGMSKPDGLFYVRSGHEEEFMRSLPLEKIWGVGTKTRERLHSAGFFTSQSIFNASLSLLKSIFGECTASFLYNAVRGIEVETFDHRTSAKSISAEHTFEYDITDSYVLETALLQLSQDVFFRLLKEQLHSKTVHLKIRYEDFTTVSIQETQKQVFATSEALFDKAKELFYKKYERGRGIRLLGAGVQNVEKGLGEDQGELFDFGQSKIQMLEKTILALKEQNPDIPLKKARLLTNDRN
jgi:nucleotidyltransferase/DNA polymerase involved in DNA repair